MAAAYDPRANQKERTRAAIVEAAARLMKGGVAPSVADAAVAAKVSRATAYRYFPTPEALQLEVAGLMRTYAPLEEYVAAMAGGDVHERTAMLMQKFNAATFGDQAQMRMALKLYQEIWLAAGEKGEAGTPMREGRRMRWLARALEPAHLPKAKLRRLQAALALTGGVEAMVVMKDVCRLDDKEALEVLRWAAQTLLKAGLNEQAFEAKAPRATKRR